MAVADGETITVVKDMGLVSAVFDERTLSVLPGDLAIGHTRYSTHGSSNWSNAQPAYRPVGRAGFALGHNGNLTNTEALAERSGMLPGLVTSDSDLVAELLEHVGEHHGDESLVFHNQDARSLGPRLGLAFHPWARALSCMPGGSPLGSDALENRATRVK